MKTNRNENFIKRNIKAFFKFIAVKRRSIILGFFIFLAGMLFYELFIVQDIVGNRFKSDEDKIIESVNNTFDLKLKDEKPTIATIVEIETLKAQNPDFYENAKNGDKLVVYDNAILIYRLSTKKIINFAKI